MRPRFLQRVKLRELRRAARDKVIRAIDESNLRHRHEQSADLEKVAERLRVDLAAEISRQVDRAVDRIIEFEIRSRRDIVYAGDQEAALQSSHFAGDYLVDATPFARPWETLGHALSLAPAGGMALEFGVASGNTLRQIARERARTPVFGFDSFQGLPESWLPGVAAGAFARTDLPEVPGAELVVGLFNDTLPGFLDAHPGPVSFLHVDCDLYSSSRTVLEQVGPRLVPGSIIVFDEFFNYPGWQKHEYRAWNEYTATTGVRFSYVAYTYQDCQVVVRIDEVNPQVS